jgi:hypothetical protein
VCKSESAPGQRTRCGNISRRRNVNKKEIELAVKEVNQQIAALEAKHPQTGNAPMGLQ